MPVSPPSLNQIINRHNDFNIVDIMNQSSAVDHRGRYLHWDKLRHISPPNDWNSDEWWFSTKVARQNLYKELPLYSINHKHFVFAQPDGIQSALHWLDRHSSGAIQSKDAITNTQTRNTYLIRSLVEEAINSSQLEGASTTRDVAKEMIRQGRAPSDQGEQMILNNYRAMQFIREIKNEDLTPSMVFELHRLVTERTLDSGSPGCFRTEADDIHVVDNMTQEYLHTPPPAHELPERLQQLCDFANVNENSETQFLHPVIKAIGLHFMLAYDHPFCDGNGRTARALFYWAMAKYGYWLMEFISISEIIKKAPIKYGRAFLYTETDDNDLTYFLIHQLDVIHQAVNALHVYLDEKIEDMNQAEQMLMDNPRLQGQLNFRQLALLRHALKNPRFSYVVYEHQQSHGVSYDVARKDLLTMADKFKLLDKSKRGKQYYFVSPTDLIQRINKR